MMELLRSYSRALIFRSRLLSMGELNFRRKFLILSLAIAVFFFGAVIGFDSYFGEDAGKSEIERVTVRFREWRQRLSGNALKPSEFEKIDFSLPGDPGYGDDPAYEFFNPAGRFKASPIPQKLIDTITTKKHVRLIFNLRRVKVNHDSISTNGLSLSSSESDILLGDFESLQVIVPHIKSDVCKKWPAIGARPSDEHLVFDLGLDNQKAVEDLSTLLGCVKNKKDGQIYYFSRSLGTRYKPTQASDWKLK